MQKALIRMGATNFFVNTIRNKPRLNKLKKMYLIRREIANHVKTK